jgi:hypothetical protein
MHQHETSLSGTESRPAGTPPLTAVVPVAPRAASHEVGIAVPVGGEPAPPEAPTAALSVQYALDQASQRWVATIVDEASGQIITTVPSAQVLHLLASLRAPSLDVHA